MGKFSSFCKRLRRDKSGNAAMIVALGIPALIGGTGLAVDTAQWYLWKRELQFAVDQAAIAGAWARSDEDTEDSYIERASQEFTANLTVVADFATQPTVQLANFSGGSGNSVAVSATATRHLPFSGFLTGEAATIYAYAQASFEEGATFTSCLIAVDDDADGAITIGGSSVLTASCGLAALSTSDEAIRVNGNPEIDAGWVLAAGGIDDWFDTNTDDTVLEHLEGLTDPFEDLSPPNPTESQVARTYSCTAPTPQTTADVYEVVTYSYSYYRGANQNNANPYNYSNPRPSSSVEATRLDQIVPAGTNDGTVTTTSTSWTNISGNGGNRIWEVRTTTTATTYSNTYTDNGVPQGTMLPGTYTGGMHIGCNTTFSTGVYILNGGTLKITGQYEVTGSNVMFVLKNGASIDIAGGANINLTAIQASDLIARGVTAAQADKLAGMLVFEDRDSTAGGNGNKINGNSATILNGTIYLPNSGIDFSGTASVTSQCLMIAAATIKLTGTTNMTSFCPTDEDPSITVLSTTPSVKLVA
ncbi:MAG: TadE/TadG family type IV pilus assembly protein [Sphingomonadaceae bacterium]